MKLVVYIISDKDSLAIKDLVNSTMIRFSIAYEIKLFSKVNSIKKLSGILLSINNKGQTIIYHSFEDSNMNAYVKNFCISNGYADVALIDYSIRAVSNFLNQDPEGDYYPLDDPASLHNRRLDALDFAIKFDDGQDFRGLSTCDIAIIGVSRSSKTPLSMYLASKGFKVSNIPLLIDSKVPKELFEIDPKKIFGLTIDKEVLKKIREERLRSLGLSSNSIYSSKERIDSEIDYALELMNDLGCLIIDVTYKSIEETSEIIINNINENKKGKEIWAQNTFIALTKAIVQWET